ncbi:MAG TPA: hypothetical protein QF882_07230, partial [Arenicellales bacterium]|nr:hypothetical protein [Arenicellales bacterium]
MNGSTTLHGLTIENDLLSLINDEVLPGTGIDAGTFWSGFSGIIEDLTPKNRALLTRRQTLETAINEWH